MSSPTSPPSEASERDDVLKILNKLPSPTTTIAKAQDNRLAVRILDRAFPRIPPAELDAHLHLMSFRVYRFLNTLPPPTATSAEVRDYLLTFPNLFNRELDPDFLLSVSKVDMTGADLRAMDYDSFKVYLHEAGFKDPIVDLLAADVQAAKLTKAAKEIQMLADMLGLEEVKANGFSRVDICIFVLLGMAPFSTLFGLYHYLAKPEEALFLCILFTVLYCLSAAFWISVLSSGLDHARFWKGHRKEKVIYKTG